MQRNLSEEERSKLTLLETIDYVRNSYGREIRIGGLIGVGKDWKDLKELLIMIKKGTLPKDVKILCKDLIPKYTENISVEGLIGDRICEGWGISIKKYSIKKFVGITFYIH